MCRLRAFALILLLPILASAQRNCNWDGKSYTHLQEFLHANGCTKLQCQNNGTVAVTERACGKEKDNRCHKVNEQFVSNKVTYLCTRNAKGDYEYVVAPSLSAGCSLGGKTYQDNEVFPSSDGCTTLQCQDRNIVTLNPPACGKSTDGKCHEVGSWFSHNGKIYQCEPSLTVSVLNPQPDLTPICQRSGVKYNTLDVFRNVEDQCDIYQCQSGVQKKLNEVCRYADENRKCYAVNKRWVFNNQPLVCVRDQERNTNKVAKVYPSPRNCTVGTTVYKHLDVFASGNGCETSQCIGGDIKVVVSNCRDQSGKCFAQNLIWKVNEDLFQCINKDPWGWTISRIFIDEPDPIPVCVNPGKDVYFVLDASGSITDPNFEKQRQFTAQLTRRFIIGRNRSNAEFLFGAVLFSTDAKLLFDLNKYLSNDPLYKELLAVPYDAGWTKTDLALKLIMDKQLFGAGSGGRSDADNYVILVTDGQSNEPDKTKEAARLLRPVATILSVGVGSGVNNAELLEISGSSENVFHIASFDALKQVQERMSEKICTIQKPGNNGR